MERRSVLEQEARDMCILGSQRNKKGKERATDLITFPEDEGSVLEYNTNDMEDNIADSVNEAAINADAINEAKREHEELLGLMQQQHQESMAVQLEILKQQKDLNQLLLLFMDKLSKK